MTSSMKAGRGRFSRLPAAAVFDARLSKTALRVLAALGIYADRHGCCWPAVGTIANRLGVSRAAVHRQLRRLQETRYVDITRCTRLTGGNAPNRYHLAYPKVTGIELPPEADGYDGGASPDGASGDRDSG